MPQPRKLAFRVQLDGGSSLVVDFRALAGAAAGAAPGGPERASSSSAAAAEEAEPKSARSQRFSIIERLEKRYGSGAVLHDVDEAAHAPKRAGRRDDDDLYDLDDPFIDDAELQQNIEDVHTLARVRTKHGGFFVNAGDEIETLARDDRYLSRMCVEDAAAVLSSRAGAAAMTTRARARRGGARRSRASLRAPSWTSGRRLRATGSRGPRSPRGSRFSAVKSRSVSCRALRLACRDGGGMLTLDVERRSRGGNPDYQGVPAHTRRRPPRRGQTGGRVAPEQVAGERILCDAHDVPPFHQTVPQGAATSRGVKWLCKDRNFSAQSNMLRLEARDTARVSKDRVEHAVEEFEKAVRPTTRNCSFALT